MNSMSKAEAMKAAKEARDRAPSPRGSSTTAIEAAMRRYLTAEQYHELAERTGSDAGKQEQVDQTD